LSYFYLSVNFAAILENGGYSRTVTLGQLMSYITLQVSTIKV